MTQQFQDSDFASLSGGRVVRIAVNPDYQGVRHLNLVVLKLNLRQLYVTRPLFCPTQMGYGSRALQLLQMYYEGKFPTMDESSQSSRGEITSVSSEVRLNATGSFSQRANRKRL